MKTAVLLPTLLLALHPQTAPVSAQPQPKAAAATTLRGAAADDEYTDPEGTYAGLTICADCSKIGVRLQLTDAPGAEDHGVYRQTLLYVDPPQHRAGQPAKDNTYLERGTWKLLAAKPGATGRQLCLYRAVPPQSRGKNSPDCYHVVHQTELVLINGFEENHEPDPFPAGFKTLLKMQRLDDGREYPMLPIDN